MSEKYNLLPGASHFQPFFWGQETHLQFSYTDTNMYCRTKVDIGDEFVTYVEMRPLDEALKQDLDAMASDNFTAPMQLFEKLPCDHRACERLEEQFYCYRLAASAATDLLEELKNLDPESDERGNIEALIDFNGEEKHEAMREIEKIIEGFHGLSGYDPKSGTIQVLAH